MSMWGTIGSILGGGAGMFLGGPAGGMAGAQLGGAIGGGMDTNAANAQQAAKNRDFQQYNSDTAHQREVADLKAAGLNPILSAHNSGSSTPSGSTAQMSNPYDKAFSSAVDLMRTMAQTNLTLAQQKTEAERPGQVIQDVATAKEQETFLRQQQITEGTKRSKMQFEINLIEGELKKLGITTLGESIKNDLLKLDIASAKEQLKTQRAEGQMNETEFGKKMFFVDRFMKAISPLIPRTSVSGRVR